MTMTDNIADMLTRIRNGQKSKLISVLVPHSKLKCNILDVLQEEGYIQGYQVSAEESLKVIEIQLRYTINSKGVISKIDKVSKPGKKYYSAIKDLGGYYNNMGIYVLSTSKGVMSDRKARHLNIGGEIICKVF